MQISKPGYNPNLARNIGGETIENLCANLQRLQHLGYPA